MIDSRTDEPRRGKRREGAGDAIFRGGLPSSLDAEKGVLSSMMLAPGKVMDDLSDLGPQHFHNPGHQVLFSTMRALWDGQQAFDFVTVTQRLRDLGELERVGGPAAVSEISTFIPTATNVDHYLAIVRDKYLRRQMLQVAAGLLAEARDSGEEGAQDVLQRAQEALFALEADNDDRIRMRHWKGDVKKAVSDIERRYRTRGQITGLSTGFGKLDGMTDGLKGSQFMVIGARPGQGKTALMMAMVNHMAVEEGKPVGVISLEMSSDQLASRVICSRAKLNLQRLTDGFFSHQDVNTVLREAGAAGKALVYIDDTPDMKLGSLYKIALQAKRKWGIVALFIDYVQLLRSTLKRAADSRAQEVADASRMCKKIAKVLNIPVIGLAQLGRDVDARGANSRPKISDLKESGQLEQDADIIALLYRPNKDKPPEEEEEEDGDDDLAEYGVETGYAKPEGKPQDGEIVELIIAKHRDGPTDTIPLRFRKEYTRFESLNGAEETAYNNGARFREKKKRQFKKTPKK